MNIIEKINLNIPQSNYYQELNILRILISDVETGADEQVDGVEAEKVHGGEGLSEDYSNA